MKTVIIDGEHLTIEDIVQVAREGAVVELSDSSRNKIQTARGWVERIIEQKEPVYGINTGFGVFSEKRISSEELIKLNRNLILSHAVGTGAPLDDEIVRAAILVRANTLAKGFSGVRIEIIDTLLQMLNRNVTPVIPSKGSLGSSGDLGPLAHLALVFTLGQMDLESESGQAKLEGEILSGKVAMSKASIKRLMLEAKEGLALINGATFTAAIAALAIFDAEILLKTAEISLAMTLEALLGCLAAFDERLHAVRGLKGQMKVAEDVRRLTKGSNLLNKGGQVQDAYSLRCAPQVQGIGWDTLDFVKSLITSEINAATDNPLLFEPGIAISGGNFHGEPLGMAMDFLGIALSEIAAISERRIYRLTCGCMNLGLPPMLVDQPEDAGLNSGIMLTQYTAASLVLENQHLAAPDSVHSLPTSQCKEDHNANSMIAARHTREIVANTSHILAIELFAAARALDMRIRDISGVILGIGTEQAYQTIRDVVKYQPGDALWGEEIERVKIIINQKFYKIIETC